MGAILFKWLNRWIVPYMTHDHYEVKHLMMTGGDSHHLYRAIYLPNTSKG